MVYIYHSFLIHSSADGHQGCFHVLAIINNAAMNTGVHVSLSDLVSLVCMPRSGIAGSYGKNFQFYWEIILFISGQTLPHLADLQACLDGSHLHHRHGSGKSAGRVWSDLCPRRKPLSVQVILEVLSVPWARILWACTG